MLRGFGFQQDFFLGAHPHVDLLVALAKIGWRLSAKPTCIAERLYGRQAWASLVKPMLSRKRHVRHW